MAASLGTDLIIAHVGDSPVYLLLCGKLLKLTRDQTVAQEMADHGSMRPCRTFPPASATS